ncbi:hypothetical protein EX30DRAFT_51211, partial [Ascodesmis nigricans]
LINFLVSLASLYTLTQTPIFNDVSIHQLKPIRRSSNLNPIRVTQRTIHKLHISYSLHLLFPPSPIPSISPSQEPPLPFKCESNQCPVSTSSPRALSSSSSSCSQSPPSPVRTSSAPPPSSFPPPPSPPTTTITITTAVNSTPTPAFSTVHAMAPAVSQTYNSSPLPATLTPPLFPPVLPPKNLGGLRRLLQL